MIDFVSLEFKRLIMHTIVAKDEKGTPAYATNETSLITADASVIALIRQRLIESSGKESRAFELEIDSTVNPSFTTYCNGMMALSDKDFINRTAQISDQLAACQTKSNIPGGYLIIIDGYDKTNAVPVYVVIKAEPHKGLKFNKKKGKPSIETLNEVFLSPSQKLFKVGIYQPSIKKGIVEKCILFDEQFRIEGSLAKYFYRNFLGFSISKNSKILCKNFYDKTSEFIKYNIAGYTEKRDIHSMLKALFISSTNVITPREFAINAFSNTELRDKYITEVVRDFDFSFSVDITLIETSLRNYKVLFPENISINGPDDKFTGHVQIIETDEQFGSLDLNDHSFTILKIKGKPFTNE